jgi:prepilin-type N-terminal cleavage/methylation domain-containing protein
MMLKRRGQAGFTLVEMMVAIGITALLMLMVNQLFFHTTRAISLGIKTGQVLVESEVIGNQLERDAAAMLGPQDAPAGFLVIVNKQYDNVEMTLPDGRPIYQNVRSDQLVFIVKDLTTNKRYQALTPQNDTTLGTQVSSPEARIWYGHVFKTDTDGTFSPTDDLGQSTANRLAHNWVLGRQQLLLVDPGDASSNLVSSSDTHADSAQWDALIQNAPTGSPYSSVQLFHGLTDVALQALTDGSNGVLDQIGAAASYPAECYLYAVPEQRLLVNPAPKINDFAAWKVAQTHSILTTNISDFIVEFAGDYTDETGTPGSDGKIDVDPTTKDVIWYSHFSNDPSAGGIPGLPKVVQPNSSYFPGSPPNAYYETSSLPSTADAVFVWRHDDSDSFTTNPPGSRWPYLIRIRYRVHDAEGRLHSTDPARLDDENNDSTGGTDDPEESIYRWDLVDNDGDGTPDEDDEAQLPYPGRWFEHIIPVSRP